MERAAHRQEAAAQLAVRLQTRKKVLSGGAAALGAELAEGAWAVLGAALSWIYRSVYENSLWFNEL